MYIEDIYNKYKDIKYVLDIGCFIGTWDYARTPNWNIVCLEPYFSNYIKKPFPSNCTLITETFSEYNSNNHFYDLIVCRFVLEHQKDIQTANKMIGKISSLLLPHGLAYFSLPIGDSFSNTIYKAYYNILKREGLDAIRDGGHNINFTKEEFESHCRNAGLLKIYSESFPEPFDKYPYTLFKDCYEYYKVQGIDLSANNIIYLGRREF